MFHQASGFTWKNFTEWKERQEAIKVEIQNEEKSLAIDQAELKELQATAIPEEIKADSYIKRLLMRMDRDAIRKTEIRLKKLKKEEEYLKSKEFNPLIVLRDTPLDEFKGIAESFNKVLRQYDERYPVNQAVSERMFLFEAERIIDLIDKYETKSEEKSEDKKEANRPLKVFQLWGYIYQWSKWIDENRSRFFYNRIETFLESCLLDKNDCLKQFHDLQASNGLFSTVDSRTLATMEIDRFQLAYDELRSKLSETPSPIYETAYAKARIVCKEVNDYKISADKKNIYFDLKLGAKILNATTDLLENHGEKELTKYSELAQATRGSSMNPNWARAGGCMLALVSFFVLFAALILISSGNFSTSGITAGVGVGLLLIGLLLRKYSSNQSVSFKMENFRQGFFKPVSAEVEADLGNDVEQEYKLYQTV